MYTKFYVMQITHAINRGLAKHSVTELGPNKWDTRINGWLKANNVDKSLAETVHEFYNSYGLKLKQYNTEPKGTHDCVICKDLFENSIDYLNVIRSIHNITRPGGTMLFNLPIGITQHLSCMTVAGACHLAKVNDYSVAYLAISNNNGDCLEKINSEAAMSELKLREILYKFTSTQDLRLAVTYLKPSKQKEFKT